MDNRTLIDASHQLAPPVSSSYGCFLGKQDAANGVFRDGNRPHLQGVWLCRTMYRHAVTARVLETYFLSQERLQMGEEIPASTNKLTLKTSHSTPKSSGQNA